MTSKESKIRKFLSKANLLDIAILEDGVYLFELRQLTVRLDKPIYTGMVCLELAKVFMVREHYKFVDHFGRANIKLLYTDTDSLIYQIFVSDLDASLIGCKDDFDFSFHPPEHPLHNSNNRSKRGKWKDEMKGELISEAVFLRPKCYCIKMASSIETSASAGVSKANQNRIHFDNYKDCLFNTRQLSVQQMRFGSVNHQIYTYNQSRIALSVIDNKRYQLDRFETLPYGHYMLG